MHNPATHWREALSTALHRTLRIDCEVDAAPSALCDVPTRSLAAIDESLRRLWWTAELPQLTSTFHSPSADADIDAQLFCAGCHADGRLRERALRLMRGRAGGLAIALALIRCDDWVAQVRQCAEDTLRTILAADPAALFAHLDLLVILHARSRMLAGAWRRQIEPALLDPAHRALRWAALDGGSSRSRRFMGMLILRAEPEQAQALALHAVEQRDPVLACWGLRDVPRLSGEPPNDDILACALRHPHASVRAHALRAYASRVPEHMPDAAYQALMQHHLLDPSASVRNVAAFACRTLGLDPREAWRAAIDARVEPQNRYALLSLGDCADADDLARLTPWLQHPSGELRCAALRGAMRAGIDAPAAELRDALRSPSTKVVALALKLGANVPAFMTRETLSNAYAHAANVLTHKRVLDATRQLDPWSALECLLDCLQDCLLSSLQSGTSARKLAYDDVEPALHAWLHETGRRYAPLSEAGKQALLQRIDAITPRQMHIDWRPIRRVVEAG